MATAAGALAEAVALLDRLPVDEAARLALTPTGPPFDELVARITARRTARAA
jgi:hypothetical protein